MYNLTTFEKKSENETFECGLMDFSIGNLTKKVKVAIMKSPHECSPLVQTALCENEFKVIYKDGTESTGEVQLYTNGKYIYGSHYNNNHPKQKAVKLFVFSQI